jgi:16S rRNA U516 pseudouridylate synthase RsuA-like enzyme
LDGRLRVTIPRGGSRREADEYIERGWVFVDGERVYDAEEAGPASGGR